MLLSRVRLDAIMSRNAPFGVRWKDDIAALGSVELAVDVGANEGQTAETLLCAFPSARIFSYEPVPSTFDVLQRRYAGSGRVTCIRAALGATPGQAEMVDGRTSSQNTMLIEAKPDESTVQVPVTTLAKEAAERGWSHIDLLKVDTEGYELEVLAGGMDLLRAGAVKFVLAECDFGRRPTDPHGYFPDIHDLLAPLGYRVVAFYTHAVDGQGWVWGDVLFMKPTTRREALSTPRGRGRHSPAPGGG